MKTLKLLIFKFMFVQVLNEKLHNDCECGLSPVENRRIVGGTNVSPHAYPWLVSLMLGTKLHCGGAIITHHHVLTAGHCITFGVHYRDLIVNVGMHDRLSSDHQNMKIKHAVKHSNFTSNAVRDINDIAILTLNGELHFNDKVRPICLASPDMDFSGVPLTVAGWGKTRQGAQTSSRYLLETKVKLVSSSGCVKSTTYRDNLVPDTMICAYSFGQDACQGDSGGPLFATYPKNYKDRWFQVGIVSWGIDCAMPEFPGVYTVVARFLNWIKEQTKGTRFCKGGAL